MKRFINITVVAACLVLASSCANKLDITPQNAIYEEQVIELIKKGDATAIKTIQSMLSPMPKYLNFWGINGMASSNPSVYSYQGLDWMRSLMGDDIVLGSNLSGVNPLLLNYYQQDVTYRIAANASNSCHWFGYSLGINDANKLLLYSSYLDPKISEEAKNTLYKCDAYARVIRAFSYMQLMEEYTPAYGKMKDVNAANSGLSIYKDYNPVRIAEARSTAKQTWDFIKEDLNEAYNDLVQIGVSVTTDYGTGELEDIDLSVVNFLKARAGLLTEDWTYCSNACKEIIEGGKYSLIANDNWGGKLENKGMDGEYSKLYVASNTNAFLALSKNPECILGYKKTSAYGGSTNNYFFKLANVFGGYSINTNDGGSMARINTELYNKIEDGDCRKAAFLSPSESYKYKFYDGSAGVILPSANLKFAATVGLSDDGQSATDEADKCEIMEFCKFRLSEVYLMMAEATQDVKYLNAIRSARGASELGAYTKDALELEWSIEMWGEGGREYYNCKRWGKNITRSQSSNHWSYAGYTVENMTIPFPIREQEDNKNWAADSVNL